MSKFSPMRRRGPILKQLVPSIKHRWARRTVTEAFIVAAIVVTFLLADIQSAACAENASFDCQKAAKGTERLICADTGLMSQDRDLAEAYQRARSALAAEDKGVLAANELDWLAARDWNCGFSKAGRWAVPGFADAAECIRTLTDARIQRLKRRANSAGAFFSPTKQPFEPHLIEAHEPDLCKDFLEAARRDYVADYPLEELEKSGLMPDPTITGGVWLPLGTRYSLRLDNAKAPLGIVLVMTSTSKAFDAYGLFVRDDIQAEDNPVEPYGYNDGLLQPDRAQGWKPIYLGGLGDVLPSLLWFKGGLYLYLRGNSGEPAKITMASGAAGLFRISASGKLSAACVAEMSQTSVRPQAARTTPDTSRPAVLGTLATIDRDLDRLSEPEFANQLCSGSDGSTVQGIVLRHKAFIERIALERPWLLFGDSTNDPPSESNGAYNYIVRWGNKDLTEFRVTSRIIKEIPVLHRDFVNYYAANFGVDQEISNRAATYVVSQILDSSLSRDAPRLSDQGDPLTFWERNGHGVSTLEDLRKAVLLGMTAVVEATPEDIISTSEKTYQERITGISPSSDLLNEDVGDPILFYSLDQPKIAKILLEKHVDVNAHNWFGKTALMSAAELDNAELVDLLLQRGADVNLAIPQPAIPNCAPNTFGKTALMFAASNSGASTIKRLLEAGANPTAVDSWKHGVPEYLKDNDRIAEAERATLMGLLKGNR